MKKNFYIKMYNKNGDNPCGCTYNYLSRQELKTVKGMINRINKGYYNIPKDATKIEIYEYTNVYNEDTYRLVYSKSL